MSGVPAELRLLEAICREVARLATAGGARPERISVMVSDVKVEVGWPDGGCGTAVEPPADVAAPADDRHLIRAPGVGTFYRSPEPGAAPFVKEGDLVRRGQQLGILEVMKLMSAVEADRFGRVTEILVTDGGPVEYGQPLISLAADDGE